MILKKNTEEAHQSMLNNKNSSPAMDAVSELMEQGERRLPLNERRWRREQGALEAQLGLRQQRLAVVTPTLDRRGKFLGGFRTGSTREEKNTAISINFECTNI
uniref:Uncharacterized protein n=1 Tax=Fundulus heteroclitus TaxID=8078 RepID=A0A3Q2QAX7_FUNHE